MGTSMKSGTRMARSWDHGRPVQPATRRMSAHAKNEDGEARNRRIEASASPSLVSATSALVTSRSVPTLMDRAASDRGTRRTSAWS